MISPIKLQAEIRFTALLNFRNIYKPIISPYLKLCKFEIFNTDTVQEYIILDFKDEGIAIDLRWDKIIFVCEGKKENLFASNGPMHHFFDILTKLSKDESFGKILNYILAEWNLYEIEKEEDQILQDFKNKYLVSTVLPDTDYNTDDLGVIINYKEKENLIKLQFGPYKAETDIETYKLKLPFSKDLPKVLTKKGILSQTIHFEIANTIDINIFRKMDIRISKLLKNIS